MIARDGYTLILIGIILTVASVLLALRYDSRILFVVSILLAILTLFTTFFFRDPDRSFDPLPAMLISPADGRIVGIETIDDPYVGASTIKVSIFLNIFDVHINRVPATGSIEYVTYHPGKFLAAYKDKASTDNERTEIGMITEEGHKIKFTQIAGLIARRIVCNLKEQDSVRIGQRFGMIKFGSRTDLFVPSGSRIDVKLGQHVAGAKTVIGFLPTTGNKGQ